jgi:hypothetical protein
VRIFPTNASNCAHGRFDCGAGTAVYWHSVVDPRGAVGRVTLDGGTPIDVDESANATSPNADVVPAVFFAREGLDGSKTHTLNLSYVMAGKLGGPYFSVYFIECVLYLLPCLLSMVDVFGALVQVHAIG